MSEFKVVLLPGGRSAGPSRVRRTRHCVGPQVEVVVKELELYRADSPPPDYSLDTEVTGVLREADAHGWDRFHLVGYSAGAAAALAVAARRPTRLLSLGLLEPAWAGDWEWSREHTHLWAAYDELARSAPEQFMPAFMRLQVRPEVELPVPPPGPAPPWMEQRPEGIRAMMHAFHSHSLDRAALTGFDRPVYFALGGLSNPIRFGEIADRLRELFRDFSLEVFPERHHFDPRTAASQRSWRSRSSLSGLAASS